MQCSHVPSSVDSILKEGLTVGWLDVENQGWRGIRERKKHTHHALQRPALPTRLPRMFGLIGERSENGNDFGPCASPTSAHVLGQASEQASVASRACRRVR